MVLPVLKAQSDEVQQKPLWCPSQLRVVEDGGGALGATSPALRDASVPPTAAKPAVSFAPKALPPKALSPLPQPRSAPSPGKAAGKGGGKDDKKKGARAAEDDKLVLALAERARERVRSRREQRARSDKPR